MALNFAEYKDKLEAFVSKQDVEWQYFLKAWSEKNPIPEMKHIVLQEVEISPKFWMALVTAIAAVATSGFRIFDRLYQVAYNANPEGWVQVPEAVSGVVAVNVGLVALAFAVAYTNKKMSEDSMNIALWVCVGISAIAGLGQAVKGLNIEWAVSSIDVVLAFAISAITAIEYLSGDMLGVEFYLWQKEKQNAKETYRKELEEAEQEYEQEHKQWLSSAKAQFGAWKIQFENWNKQNSSDNPPTPVPPQPKEQKQTNGRTVRPNSDFTRTLNELMEYEKRTSGKVLTFAELSRKLAELFVEQNIPEQERDVLMREFVQKKKSRISELRTRWINDTVSTKE